MICFLHNPLFCPLFGLGLRFGIFHLSSVQGLVPRIHFPFLNRMTVLVNKMNVFRTNIHFGLCTTLPDHVSPSWNFNSTVTVGVPVVFAGVNFTHLWQGPGRCGRLVGGQLAGFASSRHGTLLRSGVSTRAHGDTPARGRTPPLSTRTHDCLPAPRSCVCLAPSRVFPPRPLSAFALGCALTPRAARAAGNPQGPLARGAAPPCSWPGLVGSFVLSARGGPACGLLQVLRKWLVRRG